jgi:hypothetical protein
VPGLSLFYWSEKFNAEGLGCALTLAVVLGYIAGLCGLHHLGFTINRFAIATYE